MHPLMIMKGAVARMGIRAYPVSLTYEVTYCCNLDCKYCDRHTPLSSEMRYDEIFTALEQFYDLGMRRTLLDGGDPLLHKHIDEIVRWLVQKGVEVEMNTNGILVPKKIKTVRHLSLLKISLDGPQKNHEAMRGPGSFDKAITAATIARDADVKVEFTCTVGHHNADALDALANLVEDIQLSILFQPAMNSLFNGSNRDASSFQLGTQSIRKAFMHIERLKKHSKAIGNSWASLRHFRTFPEDTELPCSAGWVRATMDPEGILFQCAQANRNDRSNSVVKRGAYSAFVNLSRTGCPQCWCARPVEGNFAWGCRIDRMLPPLIKNDRLY